MQRKKLNNLASQVELERQEGKKRYGDHIREGVAELLAEGEHAKVIARTLGIAESTVRGWGSPEPVRELKLQEEEKIPSVPESREFRLTLGKLEVSIRVGAVHAS